MTSVWAGSPYVQRTPGGQAENPEEGTNLDRSQVASPGAPECRNTNAVTVMTKHAAAKTTSRSFTQHNYPLVCTDDG